MTTMTFDTTCFEKLHKSEAWMYTNVSPLANIEFAFDAPFLDDACISEYDIAPANPFVVLVNGKLHAEASRLVDGISINEGHELEGTISSRGDSVIPKLECDTVTIENTTEETIHILQLVTGKSAVAASGRVLIHANHGQMISVAETHVCTGDATHLFMPLTEIVAESSSNVTLVRAIRGSKSAYQLGQLHVSQDSSTNVQTHTITLAGRCSRHEVYAYLDGEHIESNFDGMYMLGKEQHVDNHLRVEHNEPNCDSREFYKGILDDNLKGTLKIISKGNFQTEP